MNQAHSKGAKVIDSSGRNENAISFKKAIKCDNKMDIIIYVIFTASERTQNEPTSN